MCTYNGAKFIEEQLWSIFRQSLLPREIIVSDDNSSDETILLVNKTFKEASISIEGVNEITLKVIINPTPLGVTKNFEQAISLCSQELIALCDQDDVWQPTKLEELSLLFDQSPELLFAFSNSRLVDAEGRPIGQTSFDALRVSKKEKSKFETGKGSSVLLKRNLATGATVMFRNRLFKIAKPFPSDWVHDEWLALVSSFAGQIIMNDHCLIDYRQHGNNQIGIAKAGVRQLIGRMIFSRSERNAKLYSRASEMSGHPFFQSCNPVAAIAAREKLAHEQVRMRLPAPRIRRVRPIFNEIRTGRYQDFGLGLQDIARDLIQPV